MNFAQISTVPEKFQQRKLFEHNPSVTLMRTSPDECKTLGAILGQRLYRHSTDQEKVQVWLPLHGVSAISGKDGPFYDAEADEALFAAIEEELKQSKIMVVKCSSSINDEDFAVGAAKRLLELMDAC